MEETKKREEIEPKNNIPPSKSKLNSADEVSTFAENLINTVREPLLALDKDLRVIKASRSFYEFFKVSSDETIGTLIYDLGNHQWNIPKLRELLETILPDKTTFDNYEVEHDFSTIGKRIMLLNARQIKQALGEEKIILLAIEDITERKLAEKSLTESNRLTHEFLDILFNRSNVPIIIWDSNSLVSGYNNAFKQLIGYQSDEIIGQSLEVLFPNDKIDSSLTIIKNNLNAPNPEFIEVTILTKEKGVKTVLWNSTNIYDKEGKNIVATIAQDITERKKNEEALITLETRYRRLFESAKDGILILDAESGRIIDVNPFMIELMGYSKEQFIEKEIWEIGFFKDLAANKEKFSELQQKEYVRYDDLPFETTDGRKINVEFVSNVYLVNNHKVIQCSIRDNTAQKKAERELIASEMKYRSFFEHGMDAIMLTAPDGKILSANPAACIMFGYSEEEFIKLSRNNIVDVTDPQLTILLSERKLNGHAHGELTLIRKDGTHFFAEISSAVFTNHEGLELTSIIIRDITKRKRTEKELIAAKEKAEQSDKLKSEFLAQISHEIRTPLNTVMGNTAYLNSLFGENLDAETRACLESIEVASKRIIRTIDLVLNVAELHTSGYKPNFVKVDLNADVLKKMLHEHELEANQKGLELIYICELNEPKVLADEYSVAQIFSNLVDNAVKYTKKGKVKILLKKNTSGNIIVEVKDTGIGMSKEFLLRMFEPFTQEEQGYSRSFEGAGLGLALVKRFCEINNAVIEIESEKNVGSTFRVIFYK